MSSAWIGTRRSHQFSAIDAARMVPGPFAPGANADIDGNESTSGTLGASYRSAGGTVLAANAWASTNRTDFDSTADGPAATHEERSTISAWNARVVTPVTAAWETRLQAGEMRDHSRAVLVPSPHLQHVCDAVHHAPLAGYRWREREHPRRHRGVPRAIDRG